MKRIMLVTALATLAACSDNAAAPDADATPEAAATEAAVSLAADGKPSTGKFEVTMADGTKVVTDVMADGTYSATDADGKVVETGKWEQKSPEQYCETADAEGSVQKCYAEAVDANGVYTSTDPDTGDVATVVRLEG